MIVVGRQGDQLLTNESGDVTSHLQGMFNRTISLLEKGIKPVYVFDGKPPQLKKEELGKRLEKRTGAETALETAKESADQEEIEKYSKRTVKVTRQHNEECKRLLTLMGIPYIEAPCEAEAQCAQLVKDGLAYAMSSEDMDSLTFGAPKLVRHLMTPAANKQPINEFQVAKALEELGLSMEQFVDLCILLGCDYCGTIKGIGPVRALQLVKKHQRLEEILKNIDHAKTPPPEPFDYEAVRQLFVNPDVHNKENVEPSLVWKAPDEEGLVKFLVEEKNFNEERVKRAIDKIKAAKKQGQ